MRTNKLKLLIPITILLFLSACAARNGTDALQMNTPFATTKILLDEEGQRTRNAADPQRYWSRQLGLAAINKRTDAVKYILPKIENINAYSKTWFGTLYDLEYTALHFATRAGNIEIITAILAKGADSRLRAKSTKEAWRKTAYEMALKLETPDAAKILKANMAVHQEWEQTKKQNTVTAYNNFLGKYRYSSDSYGGGAETYLKTAQEIVEKSETQKSAVKEQERHARQEAMEAKLPINIRRDKYILSVSQLLKEEKYPEAISYFEKLEALPGNIDPSLDFYHGKALLRTGQPNKALEKLYLFVNKQGSNSPLYKDALKLINEAETDL